MWQHSTSRLAEAIHAPRGARWVTARALRAVITPRSHSWVSCESSSHMVNFVLKEDSDECNTYYQIQKPPWCGLTVSDASHQVRVQLLALFWFWVVCISQFGVQWLINLEGCPLALSRPLSPHWLAWYRRRWHGWLSVTSSTYECDSPSRVW